MAKSIEIRHEPQKLHFVAYLDGVATDAVLEYRPLDERRLEFYTTYTPTQLRGRGIGGRLVKAALEYARENNLRVVPSCPFVARIIKRNPEYAELTEEG